MDVAMPSGHVLTALQQLPLDALTPGWYLGLSRNQRKKKRPK